MLLKHRGRFRVLGFRVLRFRVVDCVGRTLARLTVEAVLGCPKPNLWGSGLNRFHHEGLGI